MKTRLLFILLFLLLILPYAHSKNEQDTLFTYDKNQPILSERLPFDDFFELVKIYLEEDNSEEVIDLEYLETELKTVYEAPVNWNTATREELRSIQIISELEIEELLYYAGEYGPVSSIYELQLVENLSEPLRLLLPNILIVDTVGIHSKWSDDLKYGKHYAAIHSNGIIEPKKGFLEEKYLGIPATISAKYRFISHNFQATISMKSDAGEPFSGNEKYKRYGFDTYRFFAEAKNIPNFGNILIGSYKASFGRGLIFGNKNWGSKTQQLLNTPNQKSITGYGGTSATPTINGVAYSYQNHIISTNIFYGISNLDSDTSGGEWHSINTSGYHRTESEILRQNSLLLHTLGGNINIGKVRWNIGVNGYMAKFSLPAVPSNDIWSIYDFTGEWQWGVSAYYFFKKHKISMNGEFAVVNSAFATNNNLQFLLSSNSTISINYRYFSPKYHAFWANTYSSMSGTNGEHGASLAIDLPLYKKLSLELFADGYKTLWASVNHPINAVGFELRGNLKYLNKNGIYNLSIRYKSKPEWTKESLTIAQTGHEKTGTLLLRAYYTIDNCSLTSGFQANITLNNNEKKEIGWLLYQDITSKFINKTLTIKARIAIFNSPTWQNRFYLYEHNIPEYYYSPALYGSAFRWYLLCNYKTPVNINLSFRISQTYYNDKETNGSGYDEINAPHRTEIQGTISYSF